MFPVFDTTEVRKTFSCLFYQLNNSVKMKRFHNNSYKKNKNNEKQPAKFFESLNEKELGITEYISSLSGFHGIIKSRYNDFHVNEISLDGNIAELTDLSAPKPPPEEFNSELTEVADVESYLVEKKLLTIDQWNAVRAIAKTHLPVEIDVTELSKEQRTDIHNGIKKHFKGLIFTNTTSDETRKFIKFIFHKNKSIN